MVKFFLKGTNQEVSVDDKVKITTPIKTPYGEVDSTFEVVVTQASLEQLIKDGLVVKKDSNSLSTYVKYISKKLGLSVKETYAFLDELKSVFPYAHYYLIMEAIAEVMNGKTFCKSGYVVTSKGIVVPITDNTKISLPVFLNKEDAEEAKELLDIFRVNLPYAGK